MQKQMTDDENNENTAPLTYLDLMKIDAKTCNKRLKAQNGGYSYSHAHSYAKKRPRDPQNGNRKTRKVQVKELADAGYTKKAAMMKLGMSNDNLLRIVKHNNIVFKS
jgi:hypothetical protein